MVLLNTKQFATANSLLFMEERSEKKWRLGSTFYPLSQFTPCCFPHTPAQARTGEARRGPIFYLGP